jgi:hypothetical protein
MRDRDSVNTMRRNERIKNGPGKRRKLKIVGMNRELAK